MRSIEASTREAAQEIVNEHRVEKQSRSRDLSADPQRFKDRLATRENLVLVPYWRYIEISSWCSRSNIDYDGVSPRAYLRGKSWEEQCEVGLKALRDAGVLE